VLKQKKQLFSELLLKLGSAAVRNSNHFVDELIELGGFSKILGK
jgi:hypothetical protein